MFKFTLFFLVCAGIIELRAYRVFQEEKSKKIFAQSGENVRLICQDNVPIQHCGFTRPNGTMTLFSDLRPGTADCSVDIFVTKQDEGTWTCHIWPHMPSRVEQINKTIHLRVVDKLASLDKHLATNEGGTVTMTCITSERMIPLDNCYFTSPTGAILTADGKVRNNVENLPSERYSIPANKSIDRGDCSITLNEVSPADDGIWYCNAWLERDIKGYRDSIIVTIKDDATNSWSMEYMTTAMAILIIIIVIVACASTLYWKCKSRNHLYEKTGKTGKPDGPGRCETCAACDYFEDTATVFSLNNIL